MSEEQIKEAAEKYTKEAVVPHEYLEPQVGYDQLARYCNKDFTAGANFVNQRIKDVLNKLGFVVDEHDNGEVIASRDHEKASIVVTASIDRLAYEIILSYQALYAAKIKQIKSLEESNRELVEALIAVRRHGIIEKDGYESVSLKVHLAIQNNEGKTKPQEQ